MNNGKLIRTETGRFIVLDENNDEISTVIFRYIRNEKNQRVGAVVALDLFGELRFGYAKYNPDREKAKPNDMFALNVAVGRALKRSDICYPFSLNKNNKVYPEGVRDNLLKLYHQACHYFNKEYMESY